jgi:hypothetical protein
MQPALIAAAVTILGWYVTYAYAKRREDQTRRTELRLKYRQRQIEELYGPLLSLIEQIFNVWQVRQNIVNPKDSHRSGADETRIREFIWREYFSPLHHEIGTLLRTKLYLLENGRMPESFSRYLEHATQEECQHRLWSELHIETDGGTPWPQGFYEEVKDTLERLTNDYQGGLRVLQT